MFTCIYISVFYYCIIGIIKQTGPAQAYPDFFKLMTPLGGNWYFFSTNCTQKCKSFDESFLLEYIRAQTIIEFIVVRSLPANIRTDSCLGFSPGSSF